MTSLPAFDLSTFQSHLDIPFSQILSFPQFINPGLSIFRFFDGSVFESGTPRKVDTAVLKPSLTFNSAPSQVLKEVSPLGALHRY